MALSSDRPCLDPNKDLFGYAPFAEQIANCILNHQGEDALVLALNGPWGSGKTTVLGFVEHYLEHGSAQNGPTPIIVKFNPWWFSGRDDLAKAFLRQLQAVLPGKNEKFKQLGEMLGEFAESLGGLIDLTGATGGAGAFLGRILGNAAKRKPKDVPFLKAEIAKILREARSPILVVIDDIDRLDESEVRQLFTVVKALADFPFVTYLLAFDREAASKAIERESGLPGDRYLEKIIQVPFELPPVDRLDLRNALFKALDEILIITPEGRFDSNYWLNVYFGGLDSLFRTPRDVVRFTNTLSVTYPAVVHEVNPVDFIAVEVIRVFLPGLYDMIRSSPDNFAGSSQDGMQNRQKEAQSAFSGTLAQAIPEKFREGILELLKQIFPKLKNSYGSEWLGEWRRDMRVCHPDLFKIYFRFSLPPGAVSGREMAELINLTSQPDAFSEKFLKAKNEKRSDGSSKSRVLLDRLVDHVQKDILESTIPGIIEALFNIGDLLLEPEASRGMLEPSSEVYVCRPVYQLLKRLKAEDRFGVLERAFEKANALSVSLSLLYWLEKGIEKPESVLDGALINSEELATLKGAWIHRVRDLKEEESFLRNPDLSQVLSAWRHWGNEDEVRQFCEQCTHTDENLLQFLTAFLRHTRSVQAWDRSMRLQARLSPKWIEPYLDTNRCQERLAILQQTKAVPVADQEVVAQYLLESDMISNGKDPEGLRAFEDR